MAVDLKVNVFDFRLRGCLCGAFGDVRRQFSYRVLPRGSYFMGLLPWCLEYRTAAGAWEPECGVALLGYFGVESAFVAHDVEKAGVCQSGGLPGQFTPLDEFPDQR